MANIVKELSSKTGDLYEVLPQLENEVLAISCVGKEPEEIRAQIASVLRGTWKKTEKGYRLVADEQAWRELREKQLESDASKVAQWIRDKFAVYKNPLTQADVTKHVADAPLGMPNRLSDSVGRSLSPDALEQLQREYDSRIPGNRAAVECLRAIDPRLLAGMPAKSLRVFALQPTKAQFPLPAGTRQIMASTLSEFASFEQELAKVALPKAENVPGLEAYLESTPQLFLVNPGPVAYAEMVVTRTSLDLNFEILLRAYNQEGQFMFFGREYLDLRSSSDGSPAPDKLIPLDSADKAGFSADSIAAKNAFHAKWDSRNDGSAVIAIATPDAPGGRRVSSIMLPQRGESGNSQTLSPGLKEQLADPVKFDPLGYHAVEAIEIANETGVDNYIALLPDSLTQSLAPLVRPEVSRTGVKEELEDLGMVRFKKDDWVVWEPKRIAEAYDLRVNRQRLKSVLGSLTRGGPWRLDAMASYFFQRPRALAQAFDTSLITFLCPQAGASPIPLGPNQDMLRLWGAMSPTQRKVLLEQGSVVVSSLTQGQREILGNIIFDGLTPPEWITPEKDPKRHVSPRDRTTILGSGVPLNAIIHLEIQRNPGLLGSFDNGAIRATSVDSIIGFRLMSRSPFYGGPENETATIQAFADADLFSLRFTLSMLPDYVKVCYLQDVNFALRPRFGPEEKLSEATRERIRALDSVRFLQLTSVPPNVGNDR